MRENAFATSAGVMLLPGPGHGGGRVSSSGGTSREEQSVGVKPFAKEGRDARNQSGDSAGAEGARLDNRNVAALGAQVPNS